MGKKNQQNSERGAAGIKLLFVLIILFLAANAAYNYVPVAYDAASFKQEMQTAVVQVWAMPNAGSDNPTENLKTRIKKAAAANDIPANFWIDVKPAKDGFQARVVYSKNIGILPFGIYKYNYYFDYTAIPNGFLGKE